MDALRNAPSTLPDTVAGLTAKQRQTLQDAARALAGALYWHGREGPTISRATRAEWAKASEELHALAILADVTYTRRMADARKVVGL